MSVASLFPAPTIPYIIVAPAYNKVSAGVRALHLLCHSLNLSGQRAYMYIHPRVMWDGRDCTCPELCTPLVTQEIVDWFEAEGRHPIVVYPEVIAGNPLNAALVVRWMLNYPGLLGGDASYAPEEVVYAYSKRLARSVGLGDERVLFLPTSDQAIFYPPPEGAKREGSCFYATKYQLHHGGKLLPITQGSVEITRDLPTSQTKQEIAELFRRSEVFYAYEDTALAIEAGLCGCPTVFIPNDYLSSPLGFDDIGTDGFAWGDSPEEVARAKATVGQLGANYEALIDRYWAQLAVFAEHTQAVARQRRAVSRIRLFSGFRKHFYVVSFMYGYIRRNGWGKFIAKARAGIGKRGLGRMVFNSVCNMCRGG